MPSPRPLHQAASTLNHFLPSLFQLYLLYLRSSFTSKGLSDCCHLDARLEYLVQDPWHELQQSDYREAVHVGAVRIEEEPLLLHLGSRGPYRKPPPLPVAVFHGARPTCGRRPGTASRKTGGRTWRCAPLLPITVQYVFHLGTVHALAAYHVIGDASKPRLLPPGSQSRGR